MKFSKTRDVYWRKLGKERLRVAKSTSASHQKPQAPT